MNRQKRLLRQSVVHSKWLATIDARSLPYQSPNLHAFAKRALVRANLLVTASTSAFNYLQHDDLENNPEQDQQQNSANSIFFQRKDPRKLECHDVHTEQHQQVNP